MPNSPVTKQRQSADQSAAKDVLLEAGILEGSLVEMCKAAAERLMDAHIELHVRSRQVYSWDYETPEEHKNVPRRSAYECGFKSAWRGDKFKAIYTRSDQAQAEYDGYRDGEWQSLEAIDAARKGKA